MKAKKLVTVAFLCLVNQLLAVIAFAQDNSFNKVENDLMYSWVVRIKGQEHPAIFKVQSVKQKDDKSFALDATYRFLDTRSIPAEAELSLIGSERKLVVKRQSGEQITAIQVREKVFEGTYKNLKGETLEVSLTKTPWPQIQAMQDEYKSKGVSAVTAKVLLPINLVFTAPEPDLGKQLAALHGKWMGRWGGSLDAVLIVKKISTDSAKVLYAWGDAPQWKISAGFQEYDAKVLSADRGEIEFGALPGAVFLVKTVNDASNIQITRVVGNGSATAIFNRSDTPSSHTMNDEAIKTAVEDAWEKYCQAIYCRGDQGTIIDRTGDVVTVVINGNTRYLTYLVSGEPGNYSVELRPTSDGGRIRP